MLTKSLRSLEYFQFLRFVLYIHEHHLYWTNNVIYSHTIKLSHNCPFLIFCVLQKILSQLPGGASCCRLGFGSIPPWFRLMASISSLALVGCSSATLSFIRCQKFLIGFRSGLFPGQSSVLNFCFLRNSVTILERWQEAPSCMNVTIMDFHMHSQFVLQQRHVFLTHCMTLNPKPFDLAGPSW